MNPTGRRRFPVTTSSIRRPSQFTLAAILLVITLVAVWLVLVRFSLVLALGAAIVFPAVVRTVMVGRHLLLKGESLAADDVIELFIASLYVSVLSLLATCMVLGATTYALDAFLAPWKASPAPTSVLSPVAQCVAAILSLAVYVLLFWWSTFLKRSLP